MHVELSRGHGRQQIPDGRAGPQTDDHPALDYVGGGHGDETLLAFEVTDGVHRAQAPADRATL
ncbi:MAG: hypothetical protein WB557_27450 [Solirubrobacteraceae bacterium]